MSSSREESPDWMRSFQKSKDTVWMLSSDSESHSDNNNKSEDYIDHGKSSAERGEDECAISSESKGKPRCKVSAKMSPKKQIKHPNHLSPKENKIDDDKNREVTGDNPKDCSINEVSENDASDKHLEPHHNLPVSSSRLPLLLSDKVQQSKALVECEGDSIDLSGDMGAVGRVIISDGPSPRHEMYLDLKGTIYRTTIVPSRTFCVVNFGQSEAKIEAIMDDFIQLKPQSSVVEAETMVEGTLDGFLFDSEDDVDKTLKATATRAPNQTDGGGEETKRKKKTNKTTTTTTVATRKRGKQGGKLPPAKKVRRKAPVSKTAKSRK